MAKLEIDISVKGAADSESKVKRFADNIQRANDIIGGLNRQSMQLEKELASLNRAFNSGAISESKFNKESQRLSVELTKVRSNMASQNAQLRNYKATLDQATTSNRSFGTAQKQLQAYSNDFTGGIRSANTVALEFSRIIQDAPYGMQGIANNLQQLTANWGYYVRAAKEAAAAQGQTIGTFGLLRGAVSSLFSPINLLTLGISAVTAGWVAYEKWTQKSEKATREAEKATKSYIESLTGFQRAQADGMVDTQKEITLLNQLYGATQNTALSIDARRKAGDDLVKKYPEYFKGLNTEQVLAGKGATAYEKLARNITATAMAQAYLQRMTDNATRSLNNSLEAIDKGNRLAEVRQKILRQEAITSAGRSAGGVSESIESGNVSRLNELYEKESNLIKEISELNKGNSEVTRENNTLQTAINAQLEKGASLTGDIGNGISNNNKKLKEQTGILSELFGTQGDYFQDQIFKINTAYEKLAKDIRESSADSVTISKALGIAEATRETDLLINRFEKLFYLSKNLGTGLTSTTGNLSAPVLQITPEQQSQFYGRTGGAKVKANFDDKDLEKRLGRVVERGLRRGIDDIFSNITDLGSNFYEVFSGVFSKLAGTMNGIFSQVLSTQLGDMLGKRINSSDFSIGSLGSNKTKALIAAGGISGGLISSIAKNNTAGAAIGGALSGAAAGAATGLAFGSSLGPIGAAVGAVVGAISGIFQSAGAKKQQKLQEEALAEQRKQTKLAERAAALSFTSSIVGQQIAGIGIVTGLDRNEFGEMVTRVSGSDLEIVLQRNRDKR